MNLRNEESMKLARLRPTEDLRKRLPLHDVSLSPKRNGRRYSLQFGPEGNYLVSRNKHLKTRGVAFGESQEFVVKVPEWWMAALEGYSRTVLLEGELLAMGGLELSSEVSRVDVEREFIAFDLLWCDKDLRPAPHDARFEAMDAIIKELAHPRVHTIPSVHFAIFTEEDLEACLDTIRKEGIEGFVLKENQREYNLNWWGWKIKVADTEDAFVIDVNEERKHHLGEVTRTGMTGTMQVAQFKDGELQSIAHVPIPEEERLPLEEWTLLRDRVVEFKHSGWSGREFAFPQFVRWRDDKPKDECILKW